MRSLVLCMLVSCIGYGEFISPVEAQRIERKQCDSKPDAEERRACHSLLDKKGGQYNAEGGYPSAPHIPGPRD